MNCGNPCNSKKKRLNQIIENQELLRLRLTQEEKEYYTELFYNNAENGKVTLKNFPPLLGMLGTQISRDYADRIFLAFSSNKEEITLCEYLKYIDIYHYGDDKERCRVTCKLIDKKGNDKITYEDFKDYIQLILNTIKKINSGFTNDHMSEKDIQTLFYHISKKSDYFTSKDFEEIYNEKPELVSWIDYFKNNSSDVLIIINDNINYLLKAINYFFETFKNTIEEILGKDNLDLGILIKEMDEYNIGFQKRQKKFLKKIQQFNIRNMFDKLDNNEHEKNKRELIDNINIVRHDSNFNDCPKLNNIYDEIEKETMYPSIEKFFKKIKKVLNSTKEDELQLSQDNFSSSDDIDDLEESESNTEKEISNQKEEESKNENILKEKTFVKLNNFNLNYLKNNTAPHLDYESLKDNTIKTEEEPTIIQNNSELDIEDNYEFFSSNNYSKSNLKRRNNRFFSDKERKVKSEKRISMKTKQILDQIFNQKYNLIKKFLKAIKNFLENAKETIINIQESYHYICETYLNSHIKKILKLNEKTKKEKNDKFSTANVPAKMRKVQKKIIKAPDDSFKILLNMIMGIQIAVQSTPNFKIDENDDLKKYLNSMIYSIQTTNFSIKKQESFFLKEYAGIIFNNIRKYLGFEKEAFISSISPQDFITELMISSQTIFEELCSTGKSGSLFYYTRDGSFIVKTISKGEYKFLKKILPNYFRHLKENPLSLLPKFLGCYQLIRKIKKNKQKFNFIVMMNVFNTSKTINVRYDLKGSKIGRKVLKGTTEDLKLLNKGDIALKDLDLEERNERVYIGEKREILMIQLKKDSVFLYKNGAIDYSLLLGIHYNKKIQKRHSKCSYFPTKMNSKINLPKKLKTLNIGKENNNSTKIIDFDKEHTSNMKFFSDEKSLIHRNLDDINSNQSASIRMNTLKSNLWDYEDGGINSINGDEIYFMGIIDILTEYNCIKSIEHFFKLIGYCSEKMSCVPPLTYMNRFNDYMEGVVLSYNNNYSTNEKSQIMKNK